ncbi:segregation/condensation protein A [Acidimicrobiaceae bacterium]|nr:segregation/condensation protein A [Acidimicrobiaceae bacterium]
MEINYLIQNLESLLIKYSNNKSQIEENLHELISGLEVKSINSEIETFADFLVLASSLFEMKAKRLLPQDDEIEWIDEVQIIMNKDLAFARLLQFRAFSEIGIALASRIKKNERLINSFKYYQTGNLFPKPDVDYLIDRDKFLSTSNEVFRRYKTVEGFQHIDKDLPDLQKAIDNFLYVVDSRINTSFEEIINELDTTEEAVAFFLALLEAVRWGFVKAEQESNGINIEKQ